MRKFYDAQATSGGYSANDDIPTAEELIDSTNLIFGDWEVVKELMIEFAKLHVTAALKNAAYKATCIKYFEPEEMNYDENDRLIFDEKDEEAHYVFPTSDGGKWIDVNKESIINSYPLNNIK